MKLTIEEMEKIILPILSPLIPNKELCEETVDNIIGSLREQETELLNNDD